MRPQVGTPGDLLIHTNGQCDESLINADAPGHSGNARGNF